MNYKTRAKNQHIAFLIMELCVDLDPFEAKDNLFYGALDIYDDLNKGKANSVVRSLREWFDDIDPDDPEYDDLLDIIEYIQEET